MVTVNDKKNFLGFARVVTIFGLFFRGGGKTYF